MHTVAVVEVVLGLVALFVDWANVVAFVVQVVAARVVAAVVVESTAFAVVAVADVAFAVVAIAGGDTAFGVGKVDL